MPAFKKIFSSAIITLVVLSGFGVLFTPKSANADSSCDVTSATFHAVDVNNQAYADTANLPAWNITSYGDFSTGTSNADAQFTKKMRLVIKTNGHCQNDVITTLVELRIADYTPDVNATSVLGGPIMQGVQYALNAFPTYPDLFSAETTPDAQGNIVIDMQPGEAGCDETCKLAVEISKSGNVFNLFDDDNLASYDCNGDCNSTETFVHLNTYPSITTQGIQSCMIGDAMLIEGPHFSDGSTAYQWVEENPIFAKFGVGFTSGCIGKLARIEIFEQDPLSDDHIFTGVFTIQAPAVELLVKVGNTPAGCESGGSEFFAKISGTDISNEKVAIPVFNLECKSGVNKPWEIANANNAAAVDITEDLGITEPVLASTPTATDLANFKASFKASIKNKFNATYGIIIYNNADNAKIIDTIETGNYSKAGSNAPFASATDTQSMSIIFPGAGVYKLVSHAKDNQGHDAKSQLATIYDTTTGKTTTEQATSIADTENAYAAEAGIKPIYVDPTKYKLLEPIGSIEIVETGSVGGYVNLLVEILLGIIGIMCVLVLVFAGVQYMTTQAIAEKGEAKKLIGRAFGALFIAGTLYLVLNTINPDLLDLDPDIPNVQLFSYNPSEYEGDSVAPSSSGGGVTAFIIPDSFTGKNSLYCPGNGGQSEIIKIANSFQKKTTYRYGGKGGYPPPNFLKKDQGASCPTNTLCLDCSGFVGHVYQCAGLTVPGNSTEIFTNAEKIDTWDESGTETVINGKALKAGDLIGGPDWHVFMYAEKKIFFDQNASNRSPYNSGPSVRTGLGNYKKQLNNGQLYVKRL